MLIVMVVVVIALLAAGQEAIAMPAAGMAGSLVMVAQIRWKYRDTVWFWVVIGAVAVADIFVLASVTWPPHLGRGRGRLEDLIVFLANLAVVEILFRIVRRVIEGVQKPDPIVCRHCGKEIDKNTIRCRECGEWKPGPLPVWPLFVVLGPGLAILIGLAITTDWYRPEETPTTSDYSKFQPGEEIRDPLNRSVARTLFREKHVSCARIASMRAVNGKAWDVRCGQAHGHGVLRYTVYPKTGAVVPCSPDAEAACE